MTIKRRAVYGAAAVLLLASLYCYGRYADDQRWLAHQAREIVALSAARDLRSQIMAIRDHVRRTVRHHGAPHDERPFLRATARETLESGLGYCGESSRACINLLAAIGVPARRINLYGPMNHVIVEVHVESGRDILIDPQDNDRTNPYFDAQDRELDSIVATGHSMFNDYSTIHLRRLPIIGRFVQRVQMHYSFITWTMENPWLIKALITATPAGVLLILLAVDRLLIVVYARRLGVRVARAHERTRRGHHSTSPPTPQSAAPLEPAAPVAILSAE